METLANSYWKPVYLYIRIGWSKTNEEAKDLTQSFFMWMMETDFVTRADPNRGRFRAFLRVSLERFLSMDARKRRSLQRGGDRKFFSISMPDDEFPEAYLQESKSAPPDRILDELWKDDLIRRATEILESRLRQENKEQYFQIFQEYFLQESNPTEYKRLAEKYAVTPSDVSNYLRHAKARFRMIITDLVSETVESASDLQSELEILFGEKSE